MIGSHNTFTYMKPLKWWMYLFIPFAKCQSKSIDKQNIDFADIRIRVHKHQWYVCHGITRYDRFSHALQLLHENNITRCRVLIEGKYTEEDIFNLLFIFYLAKKNLHMQFYECKTKKLWRSISEHIPPLEVEQYVGSMQSLYGKICPFLWTYFNRNKIRNAIIKNSHTKNILIDFI